ncbi:lipid-A-disaccharide synthase [Moraxella bovoculi]|uniref:lipid-A-disaccharide synthase n=1 Tax=Moraxella bovoculi TaxID=386891 RepID=UPI003F50C734
MTDVLTIGIVAGEVSGDALGADFMHQMNAIHPNICWVGVGGQSMQKLGLRSIIDMKRLSVMGLTEVVKHLPDLLRARREILEEFDRQSIDIFVGIDAPDFNLRLGKVLKPKGVFCVQMVSPSVWAWRESRIHTIKAATNLVLCLFPFELDVYAKHNHPAVCVGHPLLQKLQADERALDETKAEFISHHRGSFPSLKKLNNQTILCMMAGSRISEIHAILPLLIDSMDELADDRVGFVLPVVNAEHARLVELMLFERAPHLLPHAHVVYGEDTPISHDVMMASDVVVLASGTATLETLLLHRPMVVVYKLSNLTYTIAKHLVKIPYVSLPNILSYGQTGKPILPELIQHDATAANIAREVKLILGDPNAQIIKLQQTTATLRKDSHHNAAEAVLTHYQHS